MSQSETELPEIVNVRENVDLTGRDRQIVRKLATSFNTAQVNVYGADPLHIGVFDKRSSIENSKLMFIQFDTDMVVTQAKQRLCDRYDEKTGYFEAKPREYVEQFHTPMLD